MYKLVSGISALVVGFLIFCSYDLVFSNQWYVSHSGALILAILSELPSLREFLSGSGCHQTYISVAIHRIEPCFRDYIWLNFGCFYQSY